MGKECLDFGVFDTAFQELEATVAQQRKDSEATAERQQKQIETLTAVVQKVSARIELSKSAPQTVLNN